jgi:small subunit ribosomal protein S18
MNDEIKNTNDQVVDNQGSEERRPRRTREGFENKVAGDSRGGRDSRDNRDSRDGRDSRGGFKSKTAKKKLCRFCAENVPVDYKNVRMLKSFITERAKIVPGRITGTCALHQRQLTVAVKRARQLSLIPYTSGHDF